MLQDYALFDAKTTRTTAKAGPLMKQGFARLRSLMLFDKRDYELLSIVNDVLSRKDYLGFKHLLTPYMHPRGIKEMAATQGLRIAYSAANLLGSLELGLARDRIEALRALNAEVMNASVTYLRRNTARVLLQIMKELVRAKDEPERQLRLAHEFRMAATGKARIVDRELRRYHLLRMPEDWSQMSFDNHVHDVNTKGRKSATHLIMDAWIKGIRHLTVIYYNFIPPEAAEELLEAADIMGISVRLGIEFKARASGKELKIIWVPRGFTGAADFLDFLRQPKVAGFMNAGRKVSGLQQQNVVSLLDVFNRQALPSLCERHRVSLPPLEQEEFARFVGTGQASLLHLGKYVHAKLFPLLQKRFETLRAAWGEADGSDKEALAAQIEELNALDAESIIETHLDPLAAECWGHRDDPADAGAQTCTHLSPAEVINLVEEVHPGNRFILNLRGLSVDEVLEILYDSGGRITHLELVNLKNATEGKALEPRRMAKLLQALNAGSVIPLKRWVMWRLGELAEDKSPQSMLRRAKLKALLMNVVSFHEHYARKPLRPSLGSDSTGQSSRLHGMGLVVRETLPAKAQKDLKNPEELSRFMALAVQLTPQIAFERRESAHPLLNKAYAFCRGHWLLAPLGYRFRRSYELEGFRPTPCGSSNIMLLGGVHKGEGNGFTLESESSQAEGPMKRPAWSYMNAGVKNTLKIVMGFIPAMLTFMLSRDWWVLKYFGPVIWFAITGLRNIVQSVLGGGGVSRTPLIRWNDYVSWSRLADSLLYTGFSVPLLDYVVKTLLLDQGLGITTSTAPLLLFSVMALANGLYISGHNLVRGLPKAAVCWNFFRSVLSIPLAVAISVLVGWLVGLHDPADAPEVLQQWAAVISKLASDVVAGVIEGLADRGSNLKMRLQDYKHKIEQTLQVQERLEILFPQSDVLAMLAEPKKFMSSLSQAHKDLENAVIVNSLDFLYFWMYQPRARTALKQVMREMTPGERSSFLLSQYVLLRKREISQLFLDGLVGKNFSKALAFYLDYSDGYLDALQRIADSLPSRPGRDVAEPVDAAVG